MDNAVGERAWVFFARSDVERFWVETVDVTTLPRLITSTTPTEITVEKQPSPVIGWR